MKRKTLFTIIIIVIFVVGTVEAGFYFLVLPKLNRNSQITISPDNLFGWKYPVAKFPSTGTGGALAYSDIRDPGGIPQGLPVRLKIPAIGVDSAIEDALISPEGRMDVPAGSKNVAWFALGPHPGQVGSAVIGGHYGISNGVPFVFYNLDKLKKGDKIYVVDDNGNTLAFAVRSIGSFDRNADATTVFTSTDGLAHLNLITCEGAWNQVNGNYPERLVVFTDAVKSEGATLASTVSVKTAANTVSVGSKVFSRPLGVGTSGADVTALQTFLEQRGLLELPTGVVNGFFGALTRAAVVKYQASAGLTQVGIFGPQTRAKLISELASGAALPNAGTVSPPTNSAVTEKNAAPNVWLAVLFATPMDGLVTSLLLISIIFMAFKIFKRP